MRPSTSQMLPVAYSSDSANAGSPLLDPRASAHAALPNLLEPSLAEPSLPSTRISTLPQRPPLPDSDDDGDDDAMAQASAADTARVWSQVGSLQSRLDTVSTLGATAAGLLSAMMLQVFALLPVAVFAPAYLTWRRERTGTMVKLSDVFASVHPALVDEILAAATLPGCQCRSRVQSALLQVSSAENFHDATVYAIFLRIWLTSSKAALVESTIYDYLVTPNTHLASLLAATAAGTPIDVAPHDGDISHGLRRLDYRHDMSGFTEAFATLFDCVVNSLAYSSTLHPMQHFLTLLDDWHICDQEHPLVAKQDETVQMCYARHRSAFEAIRHVAIGVNQVPMLPSDFQRGKNFMTAFCTRPSMIDAAKQTIVDGRIELSADSLTGLLTLHDTVKALQYSESSAVIHPVHQIDEALSLVPRHEFFRDSDDTEALPTLPTDLSPEPSPAQSPAHSPDLLPGSPPELVDDFYDEDYYDPDEAALDAYDAKSFAEEAAARPVYASFCMVSG